MIENWLITGDCHGQFNHFNNLIYKYKPEETAIVILGDAGLNFNLDHNDDDRKKYLSSFGYTIYCVRGNHEFRPEQIFFPENKIWDNNVETTIYVENKYPNIRYFRSGGTRCKIGNQNTFIIDGAYSVDALFRRDAGLVWNPQEQLSETEKREIYDCINNTTYDLILSHTCPITWQPTDLFLSGINQDTVDNSMEYFLEEIAEVANYKAWCWGHFHETREYGELEGKPGRKRLMIFQDFIPLEEIVN